MPPIQRLLLRLLERVDVSRLDGRRARGLRRLLVTGPRAVQLLSTHPAWHARWSAVRGAPDVLPADRAWALAMHLLSDAEAVVRRGAARTLAELWAAGPTRRARLEARLLDDGVPDVVVEALLDACTELWTRHPDRVDDAVALLTAAGRRPPAGALLDVGSRRLGVELERSHPETARRVRETWAASGSSHLRFHAACAAGPRARRGADLRPVVGPAAPPVGRRRSTADVPVAPSAPLDLACRDDLLLELRLAAAERRPLVLVGDDGDALERTARATAALLPGGTDDLVAWPDADDATHPVVRWAPGGTTDVEVRGERARRERRRARRRATWWSAVALAATAGLVGAAGDGVGLLVTAAAGLGPLAVLRGRWLDVDAPVEPHVLLAGGATEPAPFVDVTGAAGSTLFGDVLERGGAAPTRGEPAPGGPSGAPALGTSAARPVSTPPHERLVAGAVHRAHRGVLHLRAPSGLPVGAQRELLAVLETGRAPIRGREIASSVVESRPVPCEPLLVLGVAPREVERLEPGLRDWLGRNATTVTVAPEHLPEPRGETSAVASGATR